MIEKYKKYTFFDHWAIYFFVIFASPYLCDLIIQFVPGIEFKIKLIIDSFYSVFAPGMYFEFQKTLSLIDDISGSRYLYGIFISNLISIFIVLFFLFSTLNKWPDNIDKKKEILVFIILFYLYFLLCVVGMYTFPPEKARRVNFSNSHFALMTHVAIFPVLFYALIAHILSVFIRVIRKF